MEGDGKPSGSLEEEELRRKLEERQQRLKRKHRRHKKQEQHHEEKERDHDHGADKISVPSKSNDSSMKMKRSLLADIVKEEEEVDEEGEKRERAPSM